MRIPLYFFNIIEKPCADIDNNSLQLMSKTSKSHARHLNQRKLQSRTSLFKYHVSRTIKISQSNENKKRSKEYLDSIRSGVCKYCVVYYKKNVELY